MTVRTLAVVGVGPVELTMARSEILGLTGLIGAGYHRVPALLYWAIPGSGRIALGDRSMDRGHVTPETALCPASPERTAMSHDIKACEARFEVLEANLAILETASVEIRPDR